MVTALNRALEKLNTRANDGEIQKLVSSHDEDTGLINRIIIKAGRKIHIIPVESFYYIESQDDFVMIYCKEGHFMKQKTMKFFEAHLDSQQFVRVHRSYLVNLSQISEIQQYEKESWMVITKQGAKIKVSKAGYINLREKLNM